MDFQQIQVPDQIYSAPDLFRNVGNDIFMKKFHIYIENYAILAAGFCEGPQRAKVQLGAPWWFNDQCYGIKRQFEAAANLYPIALSVGMLTDSRSFLSYPRHELYRRVLCNYFGELVERGEYFSGEEALKTVVENVCYKNAKNYFIKVGF